MSRCKKFFGAVLTISLIFVTGCGQTVETNESPDVVLLKMQEAMQKEKSENIIGTTQGNIELKLISTETNADAKGDIAVTYDSADINNPKADISISLDGKGDAGGIEGSLNTSLSLRLLDKNMYVNIAKFALEASSNPELSEQVKAMAPMFTGKWFKIPVPDGQGLNVNNPLFGSMTEEQKTKIEELAKTIPLTKFISDAGTGGGKYRYKVEIDKDNLMKFVEEIVTVLGESFTATDKEELNAALASATGEAVLVIDGSTYHLDEVQNGTLQMIQDGKDVNASLSAKMTDTETSANLGITAEEVQITLKIDLDTQKKSSVNIVAPADAEEFDPSMMMGGL